MADLRLGAIDLPAKDVAYIRALVRLFTHSENLGWEFVGAPSYHAVVAARGWAGADPASSVRFAGPVLTLVDPPGNPELDTVAYPIHAQQFREWLRLRRESLLAALYQERMADVAALQAQAPQSVPAGHAPMHAAAPLAAERRFKLRRWPSAQQLGNDPMRIRMATLMSRSAMSLARLAELTGQSEQACRQFVAMLQESGLIAEHVPPADTPAPSMNAATNVPAVPARAGLMASLRRHLGL